MEGAMFTPATAFLHDWLQGGADTLQQNLQDFQGESPTSVAVRGLAEVFVRVLLKTGNREIPMENLGNKKMNRRHGIEYSFAKPVAGLATYFRYLPGIENLGEILLDTP